MIFYISFKRGSKPFVNQNKYLILECGVLYYMFCILKYYDLIHLIIHRKNWIRNINSFLWCKDGLQFFGIRIFFSRSWKSIHFDTEKHPFSILTTFMAAFVWSTFWTRKMASRTCIIHTITKIFLGMNQNSLFIINGVLFRSASFLWSE